jgi:hypothetical protein
VLVATVVEPATRALEGSGVGVGREMGGSELREAEELYENGGYVGNALAVVSDVGARLVEMLVNSAVEVVDVSAEESDVGGAGEDDEEATTTVMVVVLSVVEAASEDDKVTGGTPIVVVVVLRTVDTPGEVVSGTPTVVVVVVNVVDTPDAGGAPVKKERLVETERWMMLVATLLIGSGSIFDVESEMAVEEGRMSTVVVVVLSVVEKIGMLVNGDVVGGATTVVMVVVRVVDDAEIVTTAEVEDSEVGTMTICEAKDTDPAELSWALDGSAEVIVILDDDAA